MSDDGGHSDDGEDEDADADGMLVRTHPPGTQRRVQVLKVYVIGVGLSLTNFKTRSCRVAISGRVRLCWALSITPRILGRRVLGFGDYSMWIGQTRIFRGSCKRQKHPSARFGTRIEGGRYRHPDEEHGHCQLSQF